MNSLLQTAPHTLRSGQFTLSTLDVTISYYQVVIHCRCISKLHSSFIWRASVVANDILLLTKDERSFCFWVSVKPSGSDQTLRTFFNKFCTQSSALYLGRVRSFFYAMNNFLPCTVLITSCKIKTNTLFIRMYFNYSNGTLASPVPYRYIQFFLTCVRSMNVFITSRLQTNSQPS